MREEDSIVVVSFRHCILVGQSRDSVMEVIREVLILRATRLSNRVPRGRRRRAHWTCDRGHEYVVASNSFNIHSPLLARLGLHDKDML